jgi:hypothetical protein
MGPAGWSLRSFTKGPHILIAASSPQAGLRERSLCCGHHASPGWGARGQLCSPHLLGHSKGPSSSLCLHPSLAISPPSGSAAFRSPHFTSRGSLPGGWVRFSHSNPGSNETSVLWLGPQDQTREPDPLASLLSTFYCGSSQVLMPLYLCSSCSLCLTPVPPV